MEASLSARVTPRLVARRRQGLLVAFAGLAFALLATCGPSGSGSPAAFAAASGLNRKQQRSTLHTRGNLPEVLEVPLEQPEPELEPKEPLPERRIPYSMHVVSHFPNNKHLREESNARKYIEQKIVDSFENLEDIIRHIEVNLQVSENFHREKPARRSPSSTEEGTDPGARMLAPYIFKVTVTLTNQRSIVLANAEKHAQPTLTEGLDHMVDVIRRSLREEKDKMIQARKRQRALRDQGSDDQISFEDMEAEAELEDMELEADRKADEMYRRVEAAGE